MKKVFILIAVIMISVFAMVTATAADVQDIYYVAAEENESTRVNTQAVSGKTYLFLPASADLSNLVLYSDGEDADFTLSADNTTTASFGSAIDILSLFNDVSALNGEYAVTMTTSEFSAQIIIMKSENIKTLFVVSENPAEKGRAWIDTSKSNKAKGNIVYVDADGSIINADEMTEIKARGNSTFTDFEKKAYQFKMKNKFNMTGDEDNAQKKWVLLANAGDITLIHNSLVTTLAKDLGLPYTVDNTPVDLYYDGEYRGSYLLTDKVEVGEESVDMQDLDSLIEDANADNDAYENPEVVVKTIASKGETDAATDSKGSYKYVDGLTEPELAEGTTHHAYLIELDFIYRYKDEQSGFVTNRGQAVVTKNPEYLTKDTGAFISQFYQDFEDAVFSPDGYNEKTGKYYYEYCDLDSLVKIYLINEYTKNYDSYRSSTFFYLPEDEDIMYAGPIWDYDLCFTTGYDYNSQIAGNPENFWAATKYLASTLITIESFRDAVKEYLNSEDGIFYKEAEKMLGEDGNIMKYSQEMYASQRMNYKLWDITHDETAAFRCDDEETYENGIDFLLDFATRRLQWLSETTSEWNGDEYSAPMDPTKWSHSERYHEPITIKKVEPTCTKNGMTQGSVCKDSCGMVFVKREVIPALGHDYVAIETVAPTCTTEGVLSYTCSNCSDSYEESIGMIDHNTIWIIEKEPDIGVAGLKQLVCTECGMIADEATIPALEEDSSEDVSAEESTSEESSTDIPVHKHDYVSVTTEPSCTQDGLIVYSCECGGLYEEVIPAPGHDAVWETIIPADIGIEGLKQLVCKVCDEILDQVVIPSTEVNSEEFTDVDEETTSAIADETTQPAEITTDITEETTELDETTTQEPEIHECDYVAVVVAKPVCTENGLIVYTCECGKSYEEEIPATGHNGEWKITIPAEIGVEGLKQLVCTVCDEILEDEKIPALEEVSDEEISSETESQTVETTTADSVTVEPTTAEPTTAESTTAEPVTYRLGDVNFDNKITATDARLTLRIAAKLEPDATDLQRYVADVTGDGMVQAKDARLILRVPAKLASESDFVKKV